MATGRQRYSGGEPIEIERDGRVVARLSKQAVTAAAPLAIVPLPASVYDAALAECRGVLADPKHPNNYARRVVSSEPRDIAEGFCHLFTGVMERLLPDAHTAVGYGHHWVYWRGGHYDAETPRGVRAPEDLPFYRRRRKNPYNDW